MKKYILSLLSLFLLVVACQEDEIERYNLKTDSIQFDYNANEYKLDFDFAFQYAEEEDEWGYPTPVYYGDNFQEQTIDLAVSVLGWPSETDRIFKLKAVEGEGLETDLIDFESSYVFHKGLLQDTIQVKLLRPQTRGSFKANITFDIEGEDLAFDLGAEEKIVFTINVSDRYPKPNGWDGLIDWLGEYSEEKYAFVVTTLGITFTEWVNWGAHNQVLRDALEAYNSTHPNNKKDFDFPVNTSNSLPW